MLQRSYIFIKSVSPQTIRLANILGTAVTGYAKGYSQRQLHIFIYDVTEKRNKLVTYRCKNLQKCIYQRREFVFSCVYSKEKLKNCHEIQKMGKEKYGSQVKPPIHVLAKDTGGKSGIKEPNEGVEKASDKNNSQSELTLKQNPNENKANEQGCMTTSGNENDVPIGDNKQPCQTTIEVDGKRFGIVDYSAPCEYNASNANSDKLNNQLTANQQENKSTFEGPNTLPDASNQGLLNNGVHTSEDNYGNGGNGVDSSNANAVSESKVQKGKSIILIEKAKNLLRKSSKSVDHSQAVNTTDSGPEINKMNAPPPRRRQTVDPNKCSTERNFITPVRAMTDFLLKPSDLEGLRKTKRRSPYENDPPITVYWRKDVEAKAIDVWGSKENLLKEILKRDIERRRYQQNIFTVKRRLRDYRREQGRETEFNPEQSGLKGSTGRVILFAIAINGCNFIGKFGAWWYTGSHSMFSEALHSLADTINQLILAYGIYKSVQKADSDHPYGYANMRYVSSLISGVAIFCLGSGLSIYHGVIGLTDPSPVQSYYSAFLILSMSLVSEGGTLFMAFNSIRKGAKANQMSVTEYILRGNEPSVNVILLEDTAAVLGVAVAGGFMGLSALYDSHIPDAIGSLLVGGLLAGVATFIIYTNVAALVGRSIPQERLDKINSELESDVMIRAIHDVKGIDMGNSLVRYKAEMDFDGAELTRSYLDKQDLNQMLEEIKKFQTIDELEEFMLKHGENIVDMLGGEIDRIELKLRKKHPEIRHCDLEIL